MALAVQLLQPHFVLEIELVEEITHLVLYFFVL